MPCPEKFNETLVKYGIDPAIIDEINEGFEGIASSAPKSVRAAYFSRATRIMDEKAPPDTTQAIYDANACCKSGARLKASKQFAKDNQALSLAEKLAKIPEVPNMGKPELNADGSITVRAVSFWYDDKFNCACPNFNGVKQDEPISKTYCYCCGGHFRFHYEKMLGAKLRVR